MLINVELKEHLTFKRTNALDREQKATCIYINESLIMLSAIEQIPDTK